MRTDSEPVIVVATLLHEFGTTGVQTHFNALRAYARSQGKVVEVCTPYSAPRWLVYPVFALRRVIDPIAGSLSVWWYRHWHRVFLQWSLKRFLRKRSNAVIYAQCPVSALAGLRARIDRKQRVILVVHFNESQASEWADKGTISCDGLMARRIRALEGRVLPALDGIVYVSNFMRHTLLQSIPALVDTPSEVIPNWSDAPGVADISADSFDVINIGTLEPRKNQQFLLHVLAAAKRLGHVYTLALIGNGPDLAKLKQLAGQLGLVAQVRFLGFQPQAARLLRHARIYVHSANVENLPIALIEALANGKPVLAPRVGGIPDIIEDDVQGYFWSIDDAEQSAKTLIRVLGDSQLLRRLSVQASATFEARFTASQAGRRLLTFLTTPDSATNLNCPKTLAQLSYDINAGTA
jgi:glycosyltransferase involved in cell wall biosynthesis